MRRSGSPRGLGTVPSCRCEKLQKPGLEIVEVLLLIHRIYASAAIANTLQIAPQV
jgi:hypothetical protein